MAGCLNGGSCLFDKEKEAFACSCNPQWSGEKCELGKFLLFVVPYNKYRVVKEVHSLLAPGIPNTMETASNSTHLSLLAEKSHICLYLANVSVVQRKLNC